jgi:hypothetical protein
MSPVRRTAIGELIARIGDTDRPTDGTALE